MPRPANQPPVTQAQEFGNFCFCTPPKLDANDVCQNPGCGVKWS